MNNHPLIYGLFGQKLGHSLSKDYFSAKFHNDGINARYWNFESNHPESIQDIPLIYPSLRGINVTTPYKEQVIPFLNHISDDAEAIGAVNTIKIVKRKNDSPLLYGYNTDCIGFAQTLPLSPSCKAIVLGSGGAAKAVAHAIKNAGGSCIMVSRTPHHPHMIGYSDITQSLVAECNLIINATPLGMWPDTSKAPPFPYPFLDQRHLCYDLTYNPTETEFMRQAKAERAAVKNGLDMLHAQAEASWKIWND